MRKLVLVFIILVCGFSCSDKHTEPEENEKPDNPNTVTTIYDLFPDYHKYEAPYLRDRKVILENTSTKEKQEFVLDDKDKLVETIGSEWKIPDNSPYFFNQQYNAVRLIMPNEVCYKEVLKIYPNYFYYECVLRFENSFELENTITGELKGFWQTEAERQLRNPNKEWRVPQNAPYTMNFDNGMRFVQISEMCKILK